MIPKRILTTWICSPEQDRYTARHREMFAHCLSSWLRWMPDYTVEIITLGTLLADHAACRDGWLLARLDEGNWIAASHWARLEWLRRGGGIYLDADVEAVARFDPLLADKFTVGHLGNGQAFANNAVVVSAARHPFLLAWMAATLAGNHTHPEFGNLSGPFLLTDLLRIGGWDGEDREARVSWRDGVNSWPICVRRSAVFYPYTWHDAYSPACHQPDTLAVHHWASAWRAPEQQPQQPWREEATCAISPS